MVSQLTQIKKDGEMDRFNALTNIFLRVLFLCKRFLLAYINNGNKFEAIG